MTILSAGLENGVFNRAAKYLEWLERDVVGTKARCRDSDAALILVHEEGKSGWQLACSVGPGLLLINLGTYISPQTWVILPGMKNAK